MWTCRNCSNAKVRKRQLWKCGSVNNVVMQNSIKMCRFKSGPLKNTVMQTLPKAQRTRGLSSSFQSNFFKSYQVLLHKSCSNFIFRILLDQEWTLNSQPRHYNSPLIPYSAIQSSIVIEPQLQPHRLVLSNLLPPESNQSSLPLHTKQQLVSLLLTGVDKIQVGSDRYPVYLFRRFWVILPADW